MEKEEVSIADCGRVKSMITCKFKSGYESFLRHVASAAVVVRNNEILMIKRASKLHEDPGKYGLPGGFVDLDERVFESVLRELKEETGYTGKLKKLFWINDDPGRRNQVVDFVYLVEVKETNNVFDHEVESIHWFDLNNLPSKEKIAFDHAKIIKLYKKWREEKFSLPIIGKDKK